MDRSMSRERVRYPYVELPESEFRQLLDVVDALDPQQLLRLYCKVGAIIGGDQETIPQKLCDTVPPPPRDPSINPATCSIPPALRATPEEEAAGEYVDLDVDWDGEVTSPGGVEAPDKKVGGRASVGQTTESVQATKSRAKRA